jgi:hypothetical protein
MMKKAFVYCLAFCLLFVWLIPSAVQARDGITILGSSVEADFPLRLEFNLSAESEVDITEVRLHYAAERESYAQVVSEAYIEFEPDTEIAVSWSWDMRRTGGLPTGTIVRYWWTVRDTNGDTAETAVSELLFEDDRYRWQQLSEGKVTIFWYQGELSFARELMTVSQQVLDGLAEDTGAALERPVRIYIYANSQALQSAMVFPQEWTGGVTYTRFDIIAIGIPLRQIEWGRRAIAHELTHLVIDQVTLNPYNDLPTWLDEGLAMYAEGELEAYFKRYLEEAAASDALISVRSLSSPFSAHPEESYLSYAESYKIVEFLLNSYGADKMLELLDTFSEGSSYDGALLEVYGFDMDGLEISWRQYLQGQYPQVRVQVGVDLVAVP